MGRITPSWRTIYHRQIARWRRRNEFYHTLREKLHQDAFNHLLRVWWRESVALSNANVSSLMDVLKLMVNVHTQRCLNELRAQATVVDLRLRELEREAEL